MASLVVGCGTIPLDQSHRVLTAPDASAVSAITGPLFDDYSLIVNPTRVDGVALNHDGTLVAAAHANLTVWDVETERVVPELGRRGGGRGQWFGFAPTRPVFAVAAAKAFELYNTGNGIRLQSWDMPEGNWEEVKGCIAGDTMWLALRRDLSIAEITDGELIGDGMVLWSPGTGASHTVSVGIGELVFATDCMALLTVRQSGGLQYDLSSTPPEQRKWRNHNDDARGGGAAVLGTSGRRIVTRSGGRIDMVDGIADKLLASWSESGGGGWEVNNPLAFYDDRLLAYSVEHFGGFNAAPSDLHLMDVWNGGSCAVLSGHRDSILAVAFSGDGRRVATGSRDQSVRVWRVPPNCQAASSRIERAE